MLLTVRYSCVAAFVVVAALASACGSDDKEPPDSTTTASPPASPQTQTASPSPFVAPTVTEGSLPSGFPANFPIYENATPRGGAEGTTGIIATLETTDLFAGVAAFYESELDNSPWKLTSAVPTEGQEAILFSFTNDEDGLAGTASVVRPADSGITLIVVSLHIV